jgi:hypothetical protein
MPSWYETSGLKAADEALWSDPKFVAGWSRLEKKLADASYIKKSNPRMAKQAQDGRVYYQFAPGQSKFYYDKGNATQRNKAKREMMAVERKRIMTMRNRNRDHDHEYRD